MAKRFLPGRHSFFLIRGLRELPKDSKLGDSFFLLIRGPCELPKVSLLEGNLFLIIRGPLERANASAFGTTPFFQSRV